MYLLSTGIALGGLIGGTIYQTFGSRVAWRAFGIGAGIISILYAGVAVVLQRRRRQLLKDAVVETANGTIIGDPSVILPSANDGYETGYATPIPPFDTPSEKERLTA